MGSFGERLRREREMRAVSLDDIAEATKIGTRLLRALEEEQFELLPGGIFNKGFVRAYAKYLGLSEEEAVADYLQAAGESAPDPRVIAEQNASRIDRVGGNEGNARITGFPIIPVLILLVVISAGAGGWHIYQERMHERRAKQDAARATEKVAAPPVMATPEGDSSRAAGATPEQSASSASGMAAPVSLPGPTGAASAPAGEAAESRTNVNAPAKPNDSVAGQPAVNGGGTAKVGSSDVPAPDATAAGAAAANAQQFEVTVRARDKAWVSIKSDGKITVRGIIGPPDVKTIHASDQVVFWTGNAGAVDVTFNGQPVPLAGGPNEVAVVVITPKGATAGKPPTGNRTP